MNKKLTFRLQDLDISFRWLLTGQLISVLGDGMHNIAIIYWAKEMTGHPLSVGNMLFLSSAVMFLLSPLGGVTADRHDRWRIILLGNIFATAVVGTLGLICALLHPTSIGWIYAAALLLTVYRVFYGPAMSSLVSEIIKPSKQRVAQSFVSPSVEIVKALGATLGGVLIAVTNIAALFFCNALSFLISIGFALKSKTHFLLKHPLTTHQTVEHQGGIWQSFVQGLQHISETSGAKPIFLMAAAINLISAPISVILPFHCHNVFGHGADLYGFLVATLTVGSLCGSTIPGLLPAKSRQAKLRWQALSSCAPVSSHFRFCLFIRWLVWLIFASG